MLKRVILRADGNKLIGFGHIYRLLALADILQQNYYIIFALYDVEDFIKAEISKYCNEVWILNGSLPYKTPDEISAADELSFDLGDNLTSKDIVVLDGYYFGLEYQKVVKHLNCKLVCVDDLAVNSFVADVVINHAPGVASDLYKTEDYTKCCLGLDYAILRKPFFRPFAPQDKNKDVFISLGGADYFQITKRLLVILLKCGTLNTLHVMYSSSYPEELIQYMQQMENDLSGKLKLYKNLDASEIVGLMDKCTFAFVSASTVLIEAFSRGLFCLAGYYSLNQKFIYSGFVREKKAIGLGDLKQIDEVTIKQGLKEVVHLERQSTALASMNNLNKIFQTL
jgi:UDP-2,4-diacetamido-2,4,6-trideoxy-beta-L-altropyranose hydrolase